MSDTIKAWMLSGTPQRNLDRLADQLYGRNTVRRCLYPVPFTVEAVRAEIIAHSVLTGGQER